MVERRHTVWTWLIGAVLMLAAQAIGAQTIDEVRVSAQGKDAVASIVFNATVRFLQQTPTSSSGFYRITFDLIAADESVVNQSTDESKRVEADGVVPSFTVSYAASRGRGIKQLTLQLADPVAVKVRQGASSRVIDIVFPGLLSSSGQQSSSGPRLTREAEPALVPGKRYAVLLQSVLGSDSNKLLPVPSVFDRYEVFNTRTEVNGVVTMDIRVGYFATQAEAEAVRRMAMERFPQAKVLDLSKGQGDMPAPPGLALAASGLPAQKSEVAKPVESHAEALLMQAREALSLHKNDEALTKLNQLLLLPPNPFSQEAQELVGLAWERVGDARRARIEYELYLKLFPEGEGAQRVGQRLASLGGQALAASAPEGSPAPADDSRTAAANKPRLNGSIAQYYYGGKARSQSLVNIAAGIDQATLTRTTESAIVTSVDLGGRYSTPESDTRVVLRGTNSTNLQSTSHSASLLSAAYVDYKRNESGLAVRLGRQSSISGGLLGLFDGVSLTYPMQQGLKLDVMGGVPTNQLQSAAQERLLAAMVEADGLFERWGGDVYVVDQTAEGITNRRALGGEVRYSGDIASTYSLLDYDTLFRRINAASLQGSFQVPGQTTVTLLADTRKAPSLELTNALISTGATSLKTLLQLQSMAEVRAAALATSAQARQAMVSVSRPLSEKWQGSLDFRYSAIGALPAVGNFDATPATGGQYGTTVQLTGSNLYSKRDINSFNLSLLTTPLFKGAQVSYNNLTGLQDNDLTVEPSIRLYSQSDNQGVKLYRISPGFRASYRLTPKASVLGESVLEHSKTNGPTNKDTTNSIFFYLGYRYELF